MPQPLTTSAVAKQLGVSEKRVRQLDAELRPTRTSTGVRLFDQSRVDEVEAERRTRKETR